MTRECFVGFDSAWTDNPKAPGAIAGAVFDDGRVTSLVMPKLATFAEGARQIEALASTSPYLLVALDQPTVVPNHTGGRPVERVAASVISALGGGVQPASRGRIGMFDTEAPVWRFLSQLGLRQNPKAARSADEGRFLIEVFPALILAGLEPQLMARRRSAKYNPAKANFLQADWQLVCRCVGRAAETLGLSPFSVWVSEAHGFSSPRKADQDQLDAVICLVAAVAWKRFEAQRLLTIGDHANGYMATIVLPETRTVLARSASERGVPIDDLWLEDADHRLAAPEPPPVKTPASKPKISKAPKQASARPAPMRPMAATKPTT